MSRIPSIRRSYVVSQIGLIVVLLMAKTHNPSIRLCCDLFQMETRAVLMVLPGTISSELKIILEKIPFQVLSRSTTGVKVSSRSIITPIVSWLPGRQEGRHEGVNCMTKHWQGHYPLILLYALLVLKASPTIYLYLPYLYYNTLKTHPATSPLPSFGRQPPSACSMVEKSVQGSCLETSNKDLSPQHLISESGFAQRDSFANRI